MTQSPETKATEVEIKKVRKKVGMTLIGIVILVSLGIGGGIYMNNKQFKDEMVTIVSSSEAKKEIELSLKNLDSKALTSGGVIKSYEIDYSSIEHNPMGGIMFDVIVNNDKKLRVYNLLDRDISDGRFVNLGGGNTAELERLLNDGGK